MLNTRRWFLGVFAFLIYPLTRYLSPRRHILPLHLRRKIEDIVESTVYRREDRRWVRISWDEIREGDDLITMHTEGGVLRLCERWTAGSSPSSEFGYVRVGSGTLRNLLYDGGLRCSVRS